MITLTKEKVKEVREQIKRDLSLKNINQAPKLEKIVLNVGFGRMVAGKSSDEQMKIREDILKNLSLIAGQKAVFTKARGAVSAFKIRKGMIIGAKVTLRGNRMYDFFDRFINIVLPRIRDFRGISLNSIDKWGNLTVGIREVIVFPEILPENLKYPFGLEVTLHSTAKDKETGILFFKKLGIPFQEK
ncbi:50S ribosomal protein L5 [bacterium HR34]|nr:50S ribosomal protein L5 [bacterium HR34]